MTSEWSSIGSALIASAALLGAVSGCGRTAAVTDGWPPPEIAEFVIMMGDSVVATERTARTLDRLEGEISMTGQARARYVAELTGPGFLRSLQARIDAWSGAASEAVTVELPGDSVIVSSSRWNGLPQTFAVPAGAAYLHPSPALLEILLRRALVSGDSVVTMPVWLVNQHTHTSARVSRNGDRVRLELAGTVVNLVHENGYIMLAEVPSFGWTVRRR